MHVRGDRERPVYAALPLLSFDPVLPVMKEPGGRCLGVKLPAREQPSERGDDVPAATSDARFEIFLFELP